MPRLISASASSFSHLPSCTTKLTNSRLGNQQSATERVKHSKGSFKLRTSSLDAAIDSSSLRSSTSFENQSRSKDICHTLLDLEWRGVGFLDLAIFLRVFLECNCNIKHQLRLETSYPLVETMQTQTLPSKRVLRACAYQRTRERNTGIARKNIAKTFDDYLAKEGCLEDPFSKQIRRNYQPCVSTPNNS